MFAVSAEAFVDVQPGHCLVAPSGHRAAAYKVRTTRRRDLLQSG